MPAILTIQVCPSAFRRVVPELVAGLQQPFILFAPTSLLLDAPCLGFLTSVGAAFFALDSTVLLGQDGRLHAARSPGELFAPFTPQPNGADVAGRGTVIVKGLRAAPPASEPKRIQEERPAYVFSRVGRRWEVVLCGGRSFRLRNTLGARYLNYLLHEADEGISAFDLEVKVQPEKANARCTNTKQPKSDPKAMRNYREELNRLQAQRSDAQAAGQREAVEGLDHQISALESALKSGGGLADTGERARDNVRKAITVVMEQLGEGGPEEKAFAEHLRTHLSIGHECLYSHPDGRIWK
jgi:hypothetical protein